MRTCLTTALSIATFVLVAAAPRVLVDNARVRVYRAAADDLAGVNHGPAIVVSLDNATLGNAVWVDDVAAAGAVKLRGDIVIVSPLQPASASSPVGGSAPGEAVFTGMSFKTA